MSPKTKKKHLIRNWSQYNQALINRGSITFWFSDEVVQKWYEKEKTKKPGRPRRYSDDAIHCGHIIKAVYHLPFRALQGLMKSIILLLCLNLRCPNYTVFCRRANELKVPMRKLLAGEPLHIIFDSTGVKVYGEGEWKVRKHGYTKRRTWRKIHIGRCAKTGQIVASAMSSNSVSDNDVLPRLMDVMRDVPISAVIGDMAYDTEDCRDCIYERGARQIIPPKKNAKKQKKDPIGALKERDRAITRIKELGEEGRALWKQEEGYHARSKVETTMFRFKTVLGDKLSCRNEWSQATEVAVKCDVLNRMTELGMPKCYVAA